MSPRAAPVGTRPPEVAARSAGLLLHRPAAEGVEVLIAHMGGPFWARRDAGAWSIPKGLIEDGEDPLAAALREFAEELGLSPPPGSPVELGEFRQGGGKRVVIFALGGDLDLGGLQPRRVRDGVAARLGPDAQLPRDRPGRVDGSGARARAARRGSGAGARRARAAARRGWALTRRASGHTLRDPRVVR